MMSKSDPPAVVQKDPMALLQEENPKKTEGSTWPEWLTGIGTLLLGVGALFAIPGYFIQRDLAKLEVKELEAEKKGLEERNTALKAEQTALKQEVIELKSKAGRQKEEIDKAKEDRDTILADLKKVLLGNRAVALNLTQTKSALDEAIKTTGYNPKFKDAHDALKATEKALWIPAGGTAEFKTMEFKELRTPYKLITPNFSVPEEP